MDGSEDRLLDRLLGAVRIIKQAKGILMAQRHCGPEEALDLLRKASQRPGVKVQVLAQRLIEQVTSRQPPADVG